MLDKELTQDIQKWLDCPREQRDLGQGALMLLRLNRNRFLHAHIVRYADWERLEQELTKHLRIRLKCLTLRQVAEMEQREMPRIKRTIEQGGPATSGEEEGEGGKPTPHRGKRADHDNLPEEVQAIYENNGDIFRKMKQLFETLKKMENEQPCDRHEYLSILVSLDEQYRANWAEYDSWQPSDASQEDTEKNDAPATAKMISAARKYLSINRQKLAELTGEAHDILLAKMQRRVDLILSAGESFDPTYQAELAELGLTFIAMGDEVREQ